MPAWFHVSGLISNSTGDSIPLFVCLRFDLEKICAPLDCHQTSLKRQVLRHEGCADKVNDTTGKQVDDHTQIQPPFVHSQVGDIGPPDLIQSGRLETLFKPVFCQYGRLAAILAGATPIPDLRRVISSAMDLPVWNLVHFP